METIFNALKKQDGYLSIEVMVLIGLVVSCFVMVFIPRFGQAGTQVTNNAITRFQNGFDSSEIQSILGQKLF